MKKLFCISDDETMTNLVFQMKQEKFLWSAIWQICRTGKTGMHKGCQVGDGNVNGSEILRKFMRYQKRMWDIKYIRYQSKYVSSSEDCKGEISWPWNSLSCGKYIRSIFWELRKLADPTNLSKTTKELVKNALLISKCENGSLWSKKFVIEQQRFVCD